LRYSLSIRNFGKLNYSKKVVIGKKPLSVPVTISESNPHTTFMLSEKVSNTYMALNFKDNV